MDIHKKTSPKSGKSFVLCHFFNTFCDKHVGHLVSQTDQMYKLYSKLYKNIFLL